MGQTIEIFDRSIPVDVIESVDLVRPPFEQRLLRRKIQTLLGSIVGIGVIAYLIVYRFDWISLIFGLICLANIPLAIGSWFNSHEAKWLVRVKYRHLDGVEALDSPEMWYLDRAAALQKAEEIFAELKAAGAGDVHRLDFQKKYPG